MTDRRPNVVWITLESVRAANTSVHGYERDTTPNLRRIVERGGVAFSNCFSQSMWTPAASASILSGTYPFEHRVGYDGKAKEPLPENVVTLPQLLNESGYQTALFTPNTYLSKATGLDKGFEKYQWTTIQNAPRSRDTFLPWVKYLLRSGTYGHGLTLDMRRYNKTYIMQETLKSWTKSFVRDDRPFFLYGHVPNPHLPYAPPRKYLNRYTDALAMSGEEAFEFSYATYGKRERMIDRVGRGCDFTDDELAALIALYDAEIAYADEFVGTMFDHVRQLDPNTIFVITGDHGDLFGEHGLLGHNIVLDDKLTNVPMVVHGLEGIEDAREGIVQHIDLTRTLAEALSVPHEQFLGRDLRETTPTFAISQRGIPHFDEYLEANPDFDTGRYHQHPVSAIRTANFKYLKSQDRTDLLELPDEYTDRSERYPDVVADLDEKLEGMLSMLSERETSGTIEYSDAMKQQLVDLGYL